MEYIDLCLEHATFDYLDMNEAVLSGGYTSLIAVLEWLSSTFCEKVYFNINAGHAMQLAQRVGLHCK